ncbi:pyridoxal phosphate-dependent aminotransferase [Pseudomonas maumuensis]|uniref:Aminotransferase class I/II-fold pyridoxal phosphate-dependent enzyme n=1 Tax=Pseudomonas maumuensis TaxID=2842354 RepID=A0ABX8NG57_9PSED|nr:aminotransferase class I/II-fold pyridoxal phosphate-dependent enzyme [Pseudomonas maumuensis]QXH54761.1 aminotransferase class I/II-fold pyridoxal phosphate-dependent enzyme [Pseudomonas maumuensis]
MQATVFNTFFRETKLAPDSDDFFSWVRTLKASSTGQPLLDFGVADAFMPPADELSEALSALAARRELHGYVYHHSAYEAACLRHATQGIRSSSALAVLPTSGAKSALNLLCLALIDAGDVVLVTTPAYPIFSTMAQRLGATVVELPLLEENDFLPNLQQLSAEVLARAKLLVVNYPNNPTGKVPSQAECDRLLALCKLHDILMINDAAYADLLPADQPRGRFLYADGASSHCIEVHSLSKSLQIPGWRLGFILAAPAFIQALGKLSLLHESGQPRILLDAVTTVLDDRAFAEQLCQCIAKRRTVLVDILQANGLTVFNPDGAFFVYAQCPPGLINGRTFDTAYDFSHYLASELGILTIPYQVAGRSQVRFSVAFGGDDETVFSRLRQQLSQVKFRHSGKVSR